MMISNKQVSDILKMNNTQINKINGASIAMTKIGKRQVIDQLALSESSKMRSVALNALQKVPDIRWDKVEPLEQQIATGTYTVSDNEVVEKMINRVLVDEFI